MNLARDHKWLPLLNILIIVVCAGLLYLEHYREKYANREPALGRVIFQVGRTQNKARSQVIFQDLERNGFVHGGDTVRTARAAEVMLQLTGGNQIILEEFSMVVINRPEKKLRLRYSYGTLRLKKKQGQVMDVVTKNGSVSLKRGEVSISSERNGTARIRVESGSARIRSGTDESVVRAGNQALLDSSGIKTSPLVLSEHAPQDGRRILGRDEGFSVDFRWQFAREGAAGTRFEISSRRDFRGIVLKKTLTQQRLNLRLSPGVYYWRVVRGTEISEARRLNLVRIAQPRPRFPMGGSVFEYLIKPPGINFTWHTHAFAIKYRLEVSRDREFRKPLHSVETPALSLMLNLPAGTYFWRLNTIAGIPDASLTGEPVRFVVRRTPLPILAPPKSLETTTDTVQEEGLTFRWKASEKPGTYLLSIARDKSFRHVVFRRSTDKNQLLVKQKFSPGRYYWRLRLSRGDAATTSIARDVYIRPPLNPPEVVYPTPGAVVDMSTRDFLPLRWKRISQVKRYRVVLRQASTGRLIFARTVAGEVFLFKDLVKLDTGKFTWSIASLGPGNRAGKARSTSFTITLRASPGAPRIKVP